MSETELAALERDVEQARARLAHDISRLGGPSVISEFKDAAAAELQVRKDEILDSAKEAASEHVQGVIDEVKARIAANPVAALAIGAGLAWRLARQPPIASALVGYGLFSLFQTNPRQPRKPAEVVGRAVAMSATAREHIRDASGSIAGQIAEGSQVAKKAAEEWSHEAVSRGRSTASKAAAASRKVGARGRSLAADAMNHEDRDKVLLGAAAVAMAAAFGIAYQRRANGDGQD